MPHVTQLLLVLTVSSRFWQQTPAVTAQLSRRLVGAPAGDSLSEANGQSEEDWHAIAENNWIILQTTGTNEPIQRAASYVAHTDHKRSHSHSLPLHYYAYNHSGGNYQATAKDARLVKASHVAHPNSGNKHRSKEHTASAAMSKQPQRFVYGHKEQSPNAADAVSSAAIMNAKRIAVERRRLIRQQGAAEDNGDSGNTFWDNAKEVTQQQEQEKPDRNASYEPNGYEEDDVGDQDYNFNEIVAPLQNALAKVKSLCDTVQLIISDAGDGADNGHEEAEGRFSSMHTFTQPQSASSVPLSVGSGRKGKKLKKKFQKLLLPLLIAYKLKFLTLIPVLIGGLTLLVGSTGLAGFFFALFTAVMSLKATSGSKSIVVKSA